MKDLVRDLLKRAPYSLIPLGQAERYWAVYRAQHDLSAVPTPLLTMPNDNTKMRKTAKAVGVHVCGLALASSDLSGVNVCRFATPECRKGCLAYCGRNPATHARKAQIVKTLFLRDEPDAFLTLLVHELGKAQIKYGDTLRVRLNMLSDILWEQVFPQIFKLFPAVRFYDYTKWPERVTPSNYSLTYSASEKTSDAEIIGRCVMGMRVAVVFDIKPSEPMVTRWLGIDVVDGDADDDRWMNPTGVIVGLRAKGPMRRGHWDFVRMTREDMT
jgi:hypothetical protein